MISRISAAPSISHTRRARRAIGPSAPCWWTGVARCSARPGTRSSPRGDLTAHAELNLLRELPADIDPVRLAGATLYASAEPCPMCAGALFWSGVGRLVYGLSSARFYALEGDSPFQLHVGVRQVLQGGRRPIQIEGPVLEEEALRPFDGFWS